MKWNLSPLNSNSNLIKLIKNEREKRVFIIILGLLLKYNIILDHMNVNRNESLSIVFSNVISLYLVVVV